MHVKKRKVAPIWDLVNVLITGINVPISEGGFTVQNFIQKLSTFQHIVFKTLFSSKLGFAIALPIANTDILGRYSL